MPRISKEGRFDPTDIPGVHRGFPPKGVDLDTATTLGATRRKESLFLSRADLYLIKSDVADYLKKPKLVPVEAMVNFPPWIPRYDEVSGSVYTMRWNEPDLTGGVEIIEDDRNLFLITGDRKYKVIGGRAAERISSLKEIPKSWIVSQLVPQEVWGGLEFAMRQQDEICHDYGIEIGPEVEQVSSLIQKIGELNEYFKKGELSVGNYEILGEELANELERQGLTGAKDRVKQKVVARLSSVDLKDKTGRLNPTAARLKLRSALFNTIELQVVNGLVAEKSGKVYSFLMVEREITRLALEDSQRLIGNIGGFRGGQGHPAFTDSFYCDNPKKIPDELIYSTHQTLKGISHDLLRRPRVAPYLLPARLTEVLLTGVEKSKRDEYKNILEIGKAEDVLDIPSVDMLIRQRNPKEAAKTLFGCYQIISETLKDKDYLAYRF